MAAFAGLRGTGDWSADERPKNFREMILWNNPNGMAPLTALMARMKTEKTDDPEFAWWEEVLTPVRLAITSDLSNASTAATVAAGALNLVAGDLLLVEKTETSTYDNEIVLVSSVTSDTAFVIKRGYAGTSAAAIGQPFYVTRIGSTFEEGTGSPGVSLRNPTKFKNYTQIFKTKVDITRTASQTRARTGDPWANDKKRKAFDHSTGLEAAFMFGRPSETASGPAKGKPIRTTGGIRSFLSTNVKVYGTSPTEDSFIDFMQGLYNYEAGGAGDERIVFCGNGFLTNLNKLARNSNSTRINYNGGVVNLYGMNLQRWVFPFGTIALKSHPMMNVHGRYTNSAYIINPAGLIYRPIMDTKFQDNIQANDEDERAGQWITECGLELHFESSMGYIGNFVI